MIRRHSSGGTDNTDDKVLEGAKKALYVLVIAAAIMWLSPYLFPGGGLPECDPAKLTPGSLCVGGPNKDVVSCFDPANTGTPWVAPGTGTGVCAAGGGDDGLAGRISAASGEAKSVAQSIMGTAAYVLTVCAIISIVIMRVKITPNTTHP